MKNILTNPKTIKYFQGAALTGASMLAIATLLGVIYYFTIVLHGISNEAFRAVHIPEENRVGGF
ncbi:MAG: hypothetical protein LUH58_00455 [Lachnospiraceae bacterium]|nr:hypothetical protein [Lachnospiraceae bacterium]